jgi:hypothetical protein
MFDVLALWLILWVIKNAVMDVSCAITGKPNPRYELKKAKAKAAGQPAPAQHSFGTRDWLADLVNDGLQAQTEARRRRADKKRKAREKAEREAEEAEQAQAEQGQGGEQPGPSEQEPAAQPDPQTSEPGAGGAPDPEQPQPPRPTPQPAEGPDAQVIPFRKPNQQEEPPVTTEINSEVQGLDQSIAYAESLAAFAGEHGQAGNEGYIAHLTGAKVEGDGLSTAAEMQEAFTNAQAAAEAHKVELERQKAVQEAYDNNPDAGDKDFQQSGR